MAPYTRQKSEHKSVQRAMDLWRIYGEKYRTNIQRYKELLSQKRELGILPLNKLKKRILNAYPEIPFLRIEDEGEALTYLEEMRVSQVKRLIEYIEYVVEYDYAYCTISSRIVDYDFEIRHRNDRRSPLAIDPKCVRKQCKGPSATKEDY